MSLDLDELEADAEEMEDDLPVTFTFNGTNYTGQQGDLTKESQIEDAGMMPTLDLLLVVRRSVFGQATQPVSKNTVTIASVVYRIEVVRLSQDGIIAEYGLKKEVVSVNVTFDASKLNEQIWRARNIIRKEMPAIIKDESRLLLKQAIAFTPPVRSKKTDNPGVSARKAGEAAIAADLFSKRGRGLRGVFLILQDYQMNLEGSANSVRLFAKKDGQVYGVERQDYRPHATLSEMKEVHNRARVGNRGRPSKSGAYTRDVGRWRFIQRMAIGPESASRYLKYIYKHVGRMKAGWLPAYAKVGGEVPSWIDRHFSGATGFAFDMTHQPDRPFIRFGNTSKGISYVNHAFRGALEVRAKSLKKKLDYMLKGKGLKQAFKY